MPMKSEQASLASCYQCSGTFGCWFMQSSKLPYCWLHSPAYLVTIHSAVHLFRRRQWHPTPVLLPGWRSLVGCSPWGRQESDTTERLHFHFSLSCIGEGNGNPLQFSCLENPGGGGAWWAAVYGVAQSRTQLKRLSSSSSNTLICSFSVFGLQSIITTITTTITTKALGIGIFIVSILQRGKLRLKEVKPLVQDHREKKKITERKW